MGNILNCRAFFSQIWEQQKAEAEAFGRISLKLQSIDGLFESTKFEKVKGSNIVKCVQKKYCFFGRKGAFEGEFLRKQND